MPNIPIVAIIAALPGSESAVRDALEALVAPSRQDHGCIAYELYESTTVAGTFVTVEEWESQEDIDAHLASPHLQQTLAAAGDALAAPPAIHILRAV